jgi:hypothetical protein
MKATGWQQHSVRGFCRSDQEEAQAESCIREDRRQSHVPYCQSPGAVMAVHQIAPVKAADPAIEAELDRLARMPIAQLRVRFRKLFRTDPPKAFGPDLLRRSVAHRIQEKAYGGLSRSTQRLLNQMIKAFDRL